VTHDFREERFDRSPDEVMALLRDQRVVVPAPTGFGSEAIVDRPTNAFINRRSRTSSKRPAGSVVLWHATYSAFCCSSLVNPRTGAPYGSSDGWNAFYTDLFQGKVNDGAGNLLGGSAAAWAAGRPTT